jgi:hypothetical protein
LLAAGASTAVVDATGRTPRDAARERHHSKVADLLR